MMERGFCRAGSSALALGLMLAACGGGGGVNSTPTPVPSPTPGPTPAQTTNDDLIAPLVSESFANNAATASVSFTNAGDISSQSQSAQTLTINYDASTGSYVLQAGGRSQTFGSAQKTGEGTYRRTSGNVIDDLVLTPTGPSAGNVYRYVGGGFWQRQTQRSGGAVDGSLDAFVYGVPTETLVRTGKAYYQVQALGSISRPGQLLSFDGDGTMVGDLQDGNSCRWGRCSSRTHRAVPCSSRAHSAPILHSHRRKTL